MKIWHNFFLEPVNTITHLVAALAAAAASVGFVWLVPDNPSKLLTLLIFSLSMVILYLASALLHGLRLPDQQRMWLNRLDHVAIFLAIAGTYTPIVYHFFPKSWRWPVLLPVWTVACVGMVFKLVSKQIHGLLHASIYVILGWGGVLPLLLSLGAAHWMPRPALSLLFLGGVIYTVGFFIYYFEWPDPWPTVFGHHEIWHFFVMGGSFCHFLFMFWYVV